MMILKTSFLSSHFKINQHDYCVANAEIEGSQCTVCWYVDDNKISHINPKVVDQVIEKIEAKVFIAQFRLIFYDIDKGMNIITYISASNTYSIITRHLVYTKHIFKSHIH